MSGSNYQFDDPKAAFAEAEKRIQEAFKSGTTLLDLSNLGLTELPDSIGCLLTLQYLFINNNKLSILPESVTKLVELREFCAYRNRLESLPSSINRLRQLTILRVFGNRLSRLPDSIGELTNLGHLSVRENCLGSLPRSMVSLTKLNILTLHDNPELRIPPEIIGPHPNGAGIGGLPSPVDILDFYFRTHANGRALNEAKLILLGRGEVGKTCLVNRFVHNKFASTSMTRGIAITQWAVTSGKDCVRVHVWDFGGQEIQHATHQFFLTERSLYLVVLNGRSGTEDEDAEYWLRFVKAFGAGSPAIVVLNKFKLHPFAVNRRALQEKYPFIRTFVETDCKPNIKNGIPELRREIETALAVMDHVRVDFPAGWFQIKERLAVMKEPFISFAEYRKICAELGERDTLAQERLAGFLNALGIALNFREDPQLRQETVLNALWITQGVYQILTSKGLAARQGELRLADLTRMLPKKAYPPRMHGFLIELMRKFELCFPYHDDPSERRYLVPELLGKEEPELKEPFPAGECLNFRYDYRLMPEGLLPRFITRTHTMSEPSERWRTGVVLRWEGCRALVKADKQDRQVLVRLQGERQKRTRLLAVIRENFDQIHEEMKEFDPTAWVALEAHPETWSELSELEVFERQQVKEIPKKVGTNVHSLNVTSALDATDVRGARRRAEMDVAQKLPLKLFISYAREDERWRNKIEPNLGLMRREGLIVYWHDRDLVPSTQWEEEIKRRLQESHIILFLVSTDMLNSDFIQRVELPLAMELHRANRARVLPVIVRRSGWQRHFGEIEALPRGGRPISDWRQHDNACFDVEEGLRRTIAEVRSMLAI
jgi:internalin A